MTPRVLWALVLTFLMMTSGFCLADQRIISHRVPSVPTIDGAGTDDAWSQVPGITTTDIVANIPLELKSVHSGDSIYFLARYPDPDCSPLHRSWFWNEELQEYESGPDREDAFVMKWFMEGDATDLTLTSPTPYTTDMWFWKACRTNGSGYADDKYQKLSAQPMDRSTQVTSKTGSTMHLIRRGDKGKPAYKTQIVVTNEGPIVPRFASIQPEGSRADIQARGQWVDGYWTIEFGRKLQTGHTDDVQLDTGKAYRLGVSRFEISGRKSEPDSEQPDYGCGEISEIITLVFEQEGKSGVR